jgi:hypothetical protein
MISIILLAANEMLEPCDNLMPASLPIAVFTEPTIHVLFEVWIQQ